MKKNEDGEVFVYQGEKGIIITFIDENVFRKQEKALRKYCMKAYKNLIFDILPKIKHQKLQNGDYEIDLLADKKFEKVYGKIKLRFFVLGNVIVIKNIEPSDILDAMHTKELHVFKGVPYRDEKDLFKIKIVTGEK